MRRTGIHFAADLLLAAGAPHADIPHSKDSPVVSRFTGSTIVGYHEVNYDEVTLPPGPLRNSQYVETLPATGKVTRIVYESPAGKSPAEVFANFRDSLQGLQSEGKIALYGLQFDSDSATLRADSDATLKQMSDLLHQQPKLKVYIVGHTDNSGSLERNATLSQQRADSVIKALTSRFGIAPERLSAKGLASYSPVASNHDEAGKAKNRRVEMVEQ